MIIVSQDKRTIVNFENMKTIELDRETNFTSINIFRETNQTETGVCGLFIGHYETEERAKEVLEEIISTYEHMKYLQVIQNHLIEYANKPNFIYEMPKE